jgi:hypothetical protein
MLSETARKILGLIAEGRSYDQILQQHPELTYFDIFAAAREALELAQAAPPGPTPDEPSSTETSPRLSVLSDESPAAEASPVPGPAARQPSFVERARATHGRAFARWSRDEDARLEQLFRAGTPRSEIVRLLDRHDGAITRRLEKLGLIEATRPTSPRARHERRSAEPTSAETTRHDAPPGERQTMPGWELFRDRLDDDSGTT